MCMRGLGWIKGIVGGIVLLSGVIRAEASDQHATVRSKKCSHIDELSARPSTPEALQASAYGVEHLSRGEVERAVRCLRWAFYGLPHSEVIARDLGLALAQSGRLGEARTMLEQAFELGDPDGALERALVSAELGDTEVALHWAFEAGGVEGNTVAAALGEASRVRALGYDLDSVGPESPLIQLVLAVRSAAEGALGSAMIMAQRAQRRAESYSDALVFNAARALRQRLKQEPSVDVRLLGRVRAEHIVNPLWQTFSHESPSTSAALRLSATADLRGRVGSVTWSGSVAVDQRLYMVDRELLARAERLAVFAAGSLSIPLSENVQSAQLQLGLRAIDLRSNGFETRLGTSVEGGPTLRMVLADRWRGELGVYGVWTDFETANAGVFERDRVGQRARLALAYDGVSVSGGIDLTALNDEAEGQAFDVSGLALSGRLVVQVRPRWNVRGGISAALRRWGPAGDEAVIGDAARRMELRWSVGFGLSAALIPHVNWVADSFVLRSESKRGGFVSSTISTGLETAW